MNRDEALFYEAIERGTSEEAAAYLDQACAGDDALRRRVKRLLAAHGGCDSLLDEPANVAVATCDISPAISERAGHQIGPYKLIQQIGEGGMGVVYMAQQTEPVKRLVALKIIKPGMDTRQVIARFEAERQALALMDHPNIAKVLDAGTVGEPEASASGSGYPPAYAGGSPGRPYFVMELVKGIPITTYCDEKRLTPRERLELFIPVCHAVQHAHQKGIIHRDLKPTNVLIALYDGQPVPKVIDFGVAKATGGQLTDKTLVTGFGALVGTLEYMSPEQAELNQLDVDTRSDIYSLGVLLYELLTGDTPVDRQRLRTAAFEEKLRIIREEEAETVSNRIARTKSSRQTPSAVAEHDGTRSVPTTYAELDWIVARALEKDRSRRYETASSLAADIQRYLNDEPVHACPPSTMYRFQKFARKHKPALAAAAAIAACLLLGTTVSAWQAVRATAAEAQANANEAKAEASAQKADEKAKEATTQRDAAQKQRDEASSLAEQLRRTLYASNMNLAKHSWMAGDVGRVMELLDQHRPKAGDTDSRGFEWHYLNRLCNAEVLTLKGHTRPVACVAYSPDGKRLASAASRDAGVAIQADFKGELKVWDAQTGRELLAIESDGKATAFSPDGKHLVNAGSNGLFMFDAQTGKELFHVEGWEPIAYSPDGKRLASGGGDDGEIKTWDALTGQELLSLKRPKKSVDSVAFSPNGKSLASAHIDGSLRVWDAQTGQEVLSLNDAGRSVSYSPDGKTLATAGEQGLKLWNAQTGQLLFSLHDPGAEGAIFSPNGEHVATSSLVGTVIWDLKSGKAIRTIRGTWGLVYSPDGRNLATGAGNAVKVWDAEKNQEYLSIDVDARAIALNRDWRLHAAAFADNTIRIRDIGSGREIATLKGHAVPIRELSFSPDGKQLASCGGGQWNPAAGLSTDKDDRAELKLWDVETGKELFNLPVANGVVFAVAFSPDGKRLVSGSGPETRPVEFKLWDVATGKQLLSIADGTDPLADVIFSPDGKRLAASSWSRGVKVFDAQNGQELLSISRPTRVWQPLTIRADGSRLASDGAPDGLKVWDARTGQELLTLKGHANMVSSVAFNPNGTRLATASNDQTVKLWDSHTGQELLTLEGQGGSWTYKTVTFSSDGLRLATHGSGGPLKIYDATPVANP